MTMSKTCYDPQGNVKAYNVPCNPNADVSACCYIGENCISDGLCESFQVD